MVKRVLVTDEAIAVIDTLIAKFGKLIFHQSGGCCDGSSPMCFQDGELMLDNSDVCLGEIHGCLFYMSRDQFEYWKHTQLIIDAIPGNGGMFSLERPSGLRFITRSRLFSDEELSDL